VGKMDKDGRRIHPIKYPALISALERYDEVRVANIFDGYGRRGLVAYTIISKSKKK
jgi:hypothetical protein